MSELTSNQYLIIIAVLVFISIVILFLLSRSKRDTQELQQDLNKPFGTDKLMFHLRKCRMATSARAKAVGIV